MGHSPAVDVVADFGDRLVRVQVKTSTVERNGPWEITLATREDEPDDPLVVIAEALLLGTLADPWRGSRAVKGVRL